MSRQSSDGVPVVKPRRGRITAAYETLRQLILTHQLSPGTLLVETRLAARIGHTRGSLRAALQRLEQEGFVYSTDLGTYNRRVVAPLTVDDMEEVFSLIGSLEGMAARSVAGLPSKERGALAAHLDKLNVAMLKAVSNDRSDPQAGCELDSQFHRKMVNAVAGNRLRVHYEAATPHVERYRNIYAAHINTQLRISYDEHTAITRTLLLGSPLEAELVVECHWRNAAERFRAVITEMGERGVAVF